MSATESQNVLIDRQFGAQSDAYLKSAVHAAGPDLAYVTQRIAEISPAVALDLGTGGGHVSYAMAPHAGRVLACDLSERMLATVAEAAAERGLKNVETHCADVHQLPFPDGAVDFAATRYSAHHWTDLPGALKEMRRVLRKGSRAILMDIVSPGVPLLDTHLQGIELLRDPSHVRDFSVGEWLAALEGAGFVLRKVATHRVRLEFQSWVERIGTAEVHVAAIRSLQGQASDSVAAHFAIEPDGSFTLDAAIIEAEAA
ncbi:class I SAM-dependent methyltransferase [Afifella sp. IM 167]|uniref:class I SAM-dependent methyltransferase n=1 Tax=Afifella sp. IM 167 TaxID=2033586 RepID=UPI001CCD3BAA|nr:class I SAM-dependent methyltransferase [Afifella sp. IM 167]MBZ8132343.1 SAM-dependent methyltransferase [Afifella sp. IM 167]